MKVGISEAGETAQMREIARLPVAHNMMDRLLH